MANMNFRVDTKDYLGSNFASYQRASYALAISKPEVFQSIRDTVIRGLVDNTVEAVYTAFYNCLTDGTSIDGTVRLTRELGAPRYPPQKVSAFSLKAAQTMQALCEEAADILMPISAKQIAEGRLNAKSLAADSL